MPLFQRQLYFMRLYSIPTGIVRMQNSRSRCHCIRGITIRMI